MKVYASVVVLLFLAYESMSQADSVERSYPFSFNATYFGDGVSNVRGGMKTGVSYLGKMNISVLFRSKAAGLWSGGVFSARIENTHGSSPCRDLVGDVETFDNNQNGDHFYLYESWYKQTLGMLSVKVGKIDLNVDFLNDDLSCEYINSSFGVMPAVSMNMPVSIFPKPSTAAVVTLDVDSNRKIVVGVFDGDPLNLDEDRYNLDFGVSAKGGFFSIVESQYHKNTTSIKVGAFFHSAKFVDKVSNQYRDGDMGGYVLINTRLINYRNSRGVRGFVQLGIVPSNVSRINSFIGAGINYYAPFSVRENDLCGIGFGRASVYSLATAETFTELFYKMVFYGGEFFLQPEVQFIMNPGVAGQSDALVGIIRGAIQF